MSIVGLRTQKELQGIPCIEMEMTPPDKQNIATTRSFGEMQTELPGISEAVANFASACAAKLRKQKSCANLLTVFVHTNQFRKDLPQYARNRVIRLPVATNDSMELVKYALIGLKSIYKKGYHYKKAGTAERKYTVKGMSHLHYTVYSRVHLLLGMRRVRRLI